MNSAVFVIVVFCTPVFSQYGCFLNYNATDNAVRIPETIQAGDALLTVFTTDNITIQNAKFNIMPFFIELQFVSLQQGQRTYNLISKTSVTELDDNTTLCDISRRWGFDLVCLSSPSNSLFINFEVNYTDDYDPVWTKNLIRSASEFTPINTTIAILSQIKDLYTDQDCAAPNSNAPVYSIQGGNTDATFRIQPTSGEIIVDRLISYQKGETKFELIVSITTYSVWDSPGRQSSAPVVINIDDIDDNDPVFDNPLYTVHVQEETTVLNGSFWTYPPVFAFDPDTGINDSVTYSINGITDTVGIDNGTGQVWITRVLDREVEPFVNVTIKANQVHNSWRSAVATVLVVVDDINDNRPKFSINNPTLVTIPEHSASGSSVVRVLALDADEGDNALFNYTLKPDQSFFDIQTDILVSPRYGIVTVANASALDRETISSLNITVYTEEFTPQQGGDCSTGMCNTTITIQLTDINDNSPVFDNSSYRLTVRNNIKGVFLVAVNASDADEGENADLRYRCVSSYALGSDGCSVIRVDDKTGEISLSQPLDNLQVYYASIEACDSPTDVSQMRCTTVPVIISLHPDLQLNVTSYNFTVYENLPAGTYVADVLNYNNQFELQDDKFELNGRTLRTKEFLDREKQDWYTFVISTHNENNTNISVLVTVLDVNDHSPVFDNSSYRLTVVDNTAGNFVGTINASDADEGKNAELRYRCVSSVASDDACDVITVNDTTGEVVLQRSLDSSHTYYSLVEACDSPTDTQSRCTTVLVTISLHPDLELNVTSYNFTVYENLPAGTYVGDLLYHNEHFELQDDKFELNQGTLRTKDSLDREKQDQFMFVINTNNQNNTNISVLVTVLDVNDNSPVFNNTSYRLTVMDNKEDVTVDTIEATDNDEGENADLRYSCVSSIHTDNDACKQITINNTTGEIRLQKDLLDSEIYYALVQTCDGPTEVPQSRCTTVPFSINLPLDFLLNVTSYNFTVYENLPAGTYVGDLLLSDYNEHFEIQHEKFELTKGTLRTKDSLDREKQDQFMFVINTHNQNITNISVLVTVLDVNDNSPIFNNTNYKLAVMDNTKDALIETVTATDDDAGKNADLRYKCVSSYVPYSDGCTVITINDTTGDIRLIDSLKSTNISFALIEACDTPSDASQRRCTTVPIRISLPPDYELNVTSYNFTVHENLPAGTYVGDILNNDHNFELQDDTFELHERTLRTKKLLDREKQDHYLFVINTNNQNNTNITVQVTVLDVNDNSPIFNNTNYKLTVVNNTKDEFVKTIRARDADEGGNADLSYKCVFVADADGCGEITVHNETGDIRLRRPLTKSQMYFALVEACDNPVDDSQSRCTSVPIRISLPPDFDLNVTSYNFTVHENLPAGTYVGDLLDYDGHFELHHDKFQLDERTIRTKGSLDREKEDQFLFVINTNNQNNTNISVLVTVLDVNDNSPVFDRSNYRLTVVNNTRDALVHKVNASDADEGENARLQYRCMPSYVSSSNGCSMLTVNNATGEIRLQQELTSLEMYFVLVEACDTPADTSQSRCTTVPVRISLPSDFDLNVTSYNFTVHENLPAGTYVGDILNNSHNFELQDDTFELHERTLRTKKLLDREKQDHYLLVINTNNQNNTNITVQVTVLDVNDNSPVFNNSNYKLTVVNNTKDEFVETIRASDDDEGGNADLSYKCVSVADTDGCGEITVHNETGDIRLRRPLTKSQMYFALVEACDNPVDDLQSRCTSVPIRISLPPDFDLNVTSYNFTVHENLPAGTYVGEILYYDGHFELHHDKFQLDERTIRTKGSLDREAQDQYMFVINTNNQNNTNISVLVTVLDVNDNSPVFDHSNYRLTVVDNTRDALVHKVNASDADEGENARLQYRCMPSYVNSSNGCSMLTVNNATGEIRLQQELTSLEMYFVLVEACDTSADTSQSRCTTVPVRISLPSDFDLNVTSYNFTVHENLPAGTYVGDILYDDPHFELQDNTFELNGRNLQTLKSLDREMQDHYMFVINTNDQNNTNITVLVIVLDVNDNSPVFNNSIYRLTVVDNNENASLEMINASDADEGENAVLRYRCVSSVTSNDACGVMTVNDTTGEVRRLQALASSHTYYALVEACDSPTDISQRRCTTVPVSLHLPSAFNVTSYSFTVHENLPAGTYVGEILNYDYFVLQHDYFELHEGTLRTKKPLDREDQDHHNLVINTNNQNNTNISVLVIVLDVNDNNPVFNPNNGSVTLSGEETTGHVITVVNASDLDEGDNSKITYILQPDSMLQYFYINDSGAVILQTLSTLETMDLLVKASDGGSPSLSGFYTLRITIPAVNGSVVIFAPVTSDKLEKTRIERELMRILGVDVTVETVRQHSVDSSAVYITARGMSTGQPLKVEELQKLVDSKPAEIADLFRQTVPDGTNERVIAADDFTTPVIVLIVIAAVLLIALIIATVFIARAHKSRKRNKRMFKSLSTPATFYDTAKTDAEKSDESIGTINPAFVEDDESQSVTLVNETEVTSVADMQSFHEAGDNDDDVSENEGTGRPPDADSGVPSDRENGHGDDDDIDNSSDDGGSSPQSPRSSRYLEAVLDEPLLNSSDPGHDAVDVTSPEMYSDALEALLLPVDSLESGPPAEPPVDFDVQESYPTFVEEEFPKEVTEAAVPIVQAEVESDLDPVTPDDEVEDTGSLNGFLGFRIPTRSFTPPMIRKSQEQREEELEPMPEEPMPDYGKKVRFNFQVTEHEITDYNDNDEDLDEDDNDTENPEDNEEFPTPPPPLPPPPPPTLSTDDNLINESNDDSRRGDEHDPNTNEEEEITSF